MPAVYFMGYIEPRNLGLIIEGLKSITETDLATGIVTTFTVAVLDCVVSVECEIDEFRPDYVSNLYTRSLELARTAVNLMSLKKGWGLGVHLDTFVTPDGEDETLMNRIDILEGLFDSYEIENTDALFDMIASDVDLFMAMDDLIGAISTPRVVATNCARVIDAIRFLIAPNSKDKAGWKVLHETLNIDEAYLQHISKMSQLSRHGKHQFLASDIAEDLIYRSSQVLNRYLHFRLKHKGNLPLDRFPQLTAQTPQS